MKNPDLTASVLRNSLDYSEETGMFVWKLRNNSTSSTNTKYLGRTAGCKNTGGYLQIQIEGRIYTAHRLAWLYVYGEWPGQEIDHINGDRLDNRISNLRIATRSENSCNRVKIDGCSSRMKGVSFNKKSGKWSAEIMFNRKKRFLGLFKTENEAYESYRSAALDLHGEFARL